VNIGSGCNPENHGVFENDSTSPIDFNNIADQELKKLVTEWLNIKMKALKLQESNSYAIRKNPEGKFVLIIPADEDFNHNEIGIFTAKGKHIGKSKLMSSQNPNEYYCPQIDELKPGIYLALIGVKEFENVIFLQIEFVVDN